MNKTTAGVIGAGSFGLAISKLLSFNVDVLLLCRRDETAEKINRTHVHRGVELGANVRATTDPGKVAEQCRTIFPCVPSDNLRESMKNIAPYLRPSHLVIHCTKGLDVDPDEEEQEELSRSHVRTMSEVIEDETQVLRIGCLSGPNLAKEIIEGQPTATLIASEFTEVIEEGRRLLNSSLFFVFGSHDLIGAEIAGALKNVYALGSGLLAGKGLGKNIQAMLITRGLHEMIEFGDVMGSKTEAFLGTAGVGDLIATATSADSRNYRYGYELGKGKSRYEITTDIDELAEGIRTLRIAHKLANYYNLVVPITQMLYAIIYEGYPFEKALDYIMRFPFARDVDFIDKLNER